MSGCQLNGPDRGRYGSIEKLLSTLWLIILIIGSYGCSSDPKDDEKQPTTTAKAIKIKVLTIDDANIGPVISRQWRSRTENEIEVQDLTWAEVADGQFTALDGFDVVVYPSSRIGELAERQLIRPVDRSYLENAELSRREMLEFDRDDLVSWGGSTYGVSMGGPIPVLLCRTDVLEKLDRSPPQSWQEFSEIVDRLASLPTNELPQKIAIPLDGRWASHMLSLRVASAIRTPGKYSTFFDVETMTPTIDQEPFIRAAQGWARDLSGDQTPIQTPQQVLADYARGNLAMAITTLHGKWLDEWDQAWPPTVVTAVPGFQQRFDESQGGWTSRPAGEQLSVPLVGSSGLTASVLAKSKQSRSGFQFLIWLVNKQISVIVGRESANMGMSRKSHLGNPQQWLGESFPVQLGKQFADVTRRANNRRLCLMVLRIPDSDRYLEEMDNLTREVISGQANAVESLPALARKWESITDEIGRESQRQAYRHSRGLKD